jgi:hypothetical protein
MKFFHNAAIIGIAIILLALASFPLGAGDLKITFKVKAGGMGFNSNTEEVDYYATGFLRTNNDETKKDKLIDYKNSVVYMIDHNTKVINKFTAEDMTNFSELFVRMMESKKEEGSDSPIGAMMAGMIGTGEQPVAVVNKTEGEMFLGRKCENWDISVGKIFVKAIVDPSLELPEMKTLRELEGQLDKMLNAMMGSALVELRVALTKIKGIPLRYEVRMTMFESLTVETTREAIKVEEGKIPASVFELPKDYETIDGGKKMMKDFDRLLAPKDE